MTATLSDYLKTSAKAQSAIVARKRVVFDRAYPIAVQLAELREKHHLTQTELAEKTGVAQSEISRIERGALNPRCDTVARLANALGAELRLVEAATS